MAKATGAALRVTAPEGQSMSREEMEAEIARLRERLQQRGQRDLSVKVSAKGGVSVYGLQRWPVTLYAEQWERLLGAADTIRAFLAEHSGELKHKGDSEG